MLALGRKPKKNTIEEGIRKIDVTHAICLCVHDARPHPRFLVLLPSNPPQKNGDGNLDFNEFLRWFVEDEKQQED